MGTGAESEIGVDVAATDVAGVLGLSPMTLSYGGGGVLPDVVLDETVIAAVTGKLSGCGGEAFVVGAGVMVATTGEAAAGTAAAWTD